MIVMSALMFLYFILNLLKKKNRVKIERKAPVVERQNVERIFAEKDTPFDKKIKYNKMGEYEKSRRSMEILFSSTLPYIKRKINFMG